MGQLHAAPCFNKRIEMMLADDLFILNPFAFTWITELNIKMRFKSDVELNIQLIEPRNNIKCLFMPFRLLPCSTRSRALEFS